jgi:two-component system, LytTR family, sensor histidine kinase AlgZ
VTADGLRGRGVDSLRPGPTGPLPAEPPELSIVRRTWRALLEPKRLFPVLIVSAALIGVQASFSEDRLAVPLGAAMCVAFVLIAPLSWRVLFPHGLELAHGGLRLALYAAVGTAVVLVIAGILPGWLGMTRTLLSARSSMVVCLALFLVGGWGLGRDIEHDVRLRAAETRAAELEQAAERAELLALRAHLDPHFLFNTLNAIAEWCRQDPEVAEQAVLRLSSMLRTILAGVRAPAWPLAAELELAATLFELYRLRDPELYRLEQRLPVPLPAVEVPPMLLLPLAENAVKHGPAAGHRGPVVLAVTIDESAGHLLVSLENPGRFKGRRPDGEGLRMVERRLALAYDVGRGEATLTMAAVGDRTVAELLLPLRGPRRGAAA